MSWRTVRHGISRAPAGELRTLAASGFQKPGGFLTRDPLTRRRAIKYGRPACLQILEALISFHNSAQTAVQKGRRFVPALMAQLMQGMLPLGIKASLRARFPAVDLWPYLSVASDDFCAAAGTDAAVWKPPDKVATDYVSIVHIRGRKGAS